MTHYYKRCAVPLDPTSNIYHAVVPRCSVDSTLVQIAAAVRAKACGPWLAEVAVCPSERGGPTQNDLTCEPAPRHHVEYEIARE